MPTCWSRRRWAAFTASFGMILTEALAVGTPVVASDIPGYDDVVRDGVDGVLFPRGDADALTQTLLELAADPAVERRCRWPRRRAHDYAWPRVAGQVLEAYAQAIATPVRAVLRGSRSGSASPTARHAGPGSGACRVRAQRRRQRPGRLGWSTAPPAWVYMLRCA